MKDTINLQLKEAMKAKNELKVTTLRMLLAGFTKWEKEPENTGLPLDHITVLKSAAKQRRQSADEYRAANQLTLAEREEAELAIIDSFLPTKMTDEEATIALTAIFEEVKPESMKDLGKLIKAFSAKHPGLYDNKKLSEKIKVMLA